jgi:long-chain acyl-CoA synthetase
MNNTEQPWLKSYTLGPYKLERSLAPYPNEPVSEILDRTAQKYPNQTAILFQGRELKYHQLKSRADGLANSFARLGLEKGDRVCLFLPNCPEYVLSYWGVVKAGGVVVPTSIMRTYEGLLYEVSSSGSRFIVCQEGQLEMVMALLTHQFGSHPVCRCRVRETGAVTNRLHVYDFSTLIANHDSPPPQLEMDPAHDLCELAFTGGATGLPKGVMISHTSRYASIVQTLPWFLKPLIGGIKGKTSVLVSIPLFHAYGNFVQISAVNLGIRKYCPMPVIHRHPDVHQGASTVSSTGRTDSIHAPGRGGAAALQLYALQRFCAIARRSGNGN